jgi:hypothetical protein
MTSERMVYVSEEMGEATLENLFEAGLVYHHLGADMLLAAIRGELRRRDALPPLPRADLEAVLAFVLRLGTQFPGQEYPPHVLAAIRLRRWLEGEAQA